MRTLSRKSDCIHNSDEHLACADTLLVVIDSQGRISLDRNTTTYLLGRGIDAVRLLWNSERRTMIFRPVKLATEFSCPIVRRKTSQQAAFSGQRFFRRVGWRTDRALLLPLKWRERERLLEVALPPEGLFARVNSQTTQEETRRDSSP